ncbi:MAG: SGNH/GDSL hydrolase family protein, partial [Acidimicrobiales bacterium]
GKAVCAILGASIDEQVHYPTSSARSWVGMLKAALQGPAGSPADGGSGFVGVNYAAIYQAPGFASYATEYVNDPMFVAASAGWAVGTAHDGPGVEQLQSNTSGDTITWKNIRGTTITVFFFKFVPAGGNSGGLWTPAIDGTSQAQQTCAGGTPTNGDGAGNPAQVSFASSAGAHIVAVTNNSTGATVYAFIEGVSGENASGVIVNNFAAGSRASGDYVTGSSPILNGGSSYPCDLAIYSLAANDAIGNVTDDTWESNVRVSLDAIRAGKSGQTDLVILMHHIGTADGSSHYWNKYVMRARGIAEAYGAALINPWAMLRNNYAYAQALGYFGNQAAPGAAGTDFIHPGDAGHQFIFNAVAPLLTAAA